MLINKLKDLQKINSSFKDNIPNSIKYQGIKKFVNIDNMKMQEKTKKNLPELKLTKLKKRPDTEFENDYRGKSINNTNIQLNVKKHQNHSKKQKSHSLMKKNDIIFPKISNKNLGEYGSFDKRFDIKNNINKKQNFKLGLYNGNNNINNIAHLPSRLLKIDKNKDFEVDKNDKIFQKNETLNIQKVKSKIPKYPINSKTKNNINKIQQKKLKLTKKEPSNIINDNNINSLLSPIPDISNLSNNNNLKNKTASSINNNIINDSPPSSLLDAPPSLSSLSASPSSSTSSISEELKELKELELMTEKLTILQNIVNSLGGFNSLNTKKTVNLTPEIFKNTYKNFEKSIASTPSEINEKDIIKGYAYNSSNGNVRDYNEDAITATKVIINNDENEYFYFFGVYDGHEERDVLFI